MNLKNRLVAGVGLMLICTMGAQAQVVEQWTGYTKVISLYPASEGLYVITEYANPSWSTCDSGRRWLIQSTHPNYSTLAATAIATFMAGKQINLVINVSGAQCGPTVNRFTVAD